VIFVAGVDLVSGMGDGWEQADRRPACTALLSSVVLGSLGLGLLPSLVSMVAELFCAGGARIGGGMNEVWWVLLMQLLVSKVLSTWVNFVSSVCSLPT
jgi:hypothetical protein